MRFRAKLTIAMVLLLSLTYGIGGSLMIAQSFSASIDRERDAQRIHYFITHPAVQQVINTLKTLYCP